MMHVLAMAALLASGATTTPVQVGGDPHIQVARYSPSAGVSLRGYLGYQTVIEFEPGERIENVAIGDATAWQVTPSKTAGALFVKPTGIAPPTNMTVITDRRTYSFALTVAPAKSSSAMATWVLRFQLPAPAPTAVATARPDPVTAAGKNADYTSTGAQAILPSQVFDDGVRTYFAWGPQVAMPAIYATNPDGSEGLVNFTMRDGFAVVQQTAGRFVLRQGESVATVTSTPGSHEQVVTRSKSVKNER